MRGIDQVDVACRELLLVASSDRNTTLYLEESKKKAEAEQSDKRNAVSDHIVELKKKKARLQQDISSLEASADTLLLLTKAETKHAIKYVTEANSLRRTVKEKAEKLEVLSCS